MKTFGANLKTRAQLALSIPASDIQCSLDVETTLASRNKFSLYVKKK